jgi:acetyltransferase-like isoleucine patch superfamily enzyme
MNHIGPLFLVLYRAYDRLIGKCFSVLAAGAFAEFGKKSTIVPPVRLFGEERIAIGNGVFVGGGSWLQSLPDEGSRAVALSIGSGTSIAGGCVLSAVRQIVLEEDVLLARNVYISDHIHKYSCTGMPVLAQGVDKVSPVRIRRGAWLGQNVVVCPGVTIGKGAVVGANSVVTRDVPDFCVVAGAPARLLKNIVDERVPTADLQTANELIVEGSRG